MIYFSLIIPLVTIVLLLVYFKERTTWWEFLVIVAVPVLLIIGMKALVETSQTNDTEYWTGWVVKGEYFEEWTEEYEETYSSTDSDGNVTWHTRTVTDYHGPEYYAIDSNGVKISVTLQHYRWLASRFTNNKETTLYHADQIKLYLGDGDKWTTVWNNKEDTRVIATTTHTYENRTQASRVFYFPPVDEEDKKQFGLYDYAKTSSGGLFSGAVNYHTVPSILGNGGPTTTAANERLRWHNAMLGKKKQVRMWVLIFKDQSESAAHFQKNYWQGGNKNEFILCIGTDKTNNVEWANVISWCEQERLKVDVRDFVLGQKKLDLTEVVEQMATQVNRQWKRREFAEFSYLSVQPPLWGIMLTFFLTLLVDGGLAYWVVHNEYRDESGYRPRKRRYR